MNTTEEVATKLVDYCRKGEWRKALDDLYAKDIVSVEAQRDGKYAGGNARHRSSARENRLVGERTWKCTAQR